MVAFRDPRRRRRKPRTKPNRFAASPKAEPFSVLSDDRRERTANDDVEDDERRRLPASIAKPLTFSEVAQRDGRDRTVAFRATATEAAETKRSHRVLSGNFRSTGRNRDPKFEFC
eukprot:CAMPEP_0197197366 /NCGR_PEP_ID=MMETSP1423-20130617/32830_1 /TAXON_ID=476441 /ORGANISM="Pseudo-nitzschia heimii, Strain UNC1101" /LENGTH=114 /DNA_ID=CAMNT_0042651187 /DNA_START=1775 /DNA_END=2116 /DNA_ORIENTATION=+